MPVRHRHDVTQRLDDAGFVVGEHDADQGLGSLASKLVKGIEIDDALAVDRNDIRRACPRPWRTSSTEGCSIAETIRRSTGAPFNARLLASLPPLVKTTMGAIDAKAPRYDLACIIEKRMRLAALAHGSRRHCRQAPSAASIAFLRGLAQGARGIMVEIDAHQPRSGLCAHGAPWPAGSEAASARLRLLTTSSSVTLARKVFTCRPIEDHRSWVQQRSPLTQPSTASPRSGSSSSVRPRRR